MSRVLKLIRVVAVYLLAGLVASVGVAWGLAWWVNVSSRPVEHASAVDEAAMLSSAGGSPTVWPARVAARSQLRSFGSYRRTVELIPARTSFEWTPALVPAMGGVQWFPGAFDIEPFLGQVAPDQNVLPQWTFAIPDNGAWGRAYSIDEEVPADLFLMEDARGFPVLCLWNEWERMPDGSLRPIGGWQLPPSNTNPITGLPDPLGGRVLPLRPIWAGLAANTVFYALVFFAVVRTIAGLRVWRRFKRGLCPACAYDLRLDYSRGCSECGRGVVRAERALR